MQSWFEDDAVIRELVERRLRQKPDVVGTTGTSEEVLPIWTRGLGGNGSCCRRCGCKLAAVTPGAGKIGVVLAHELVAGHPLTELPGMVVIAERSIFAARVGTW